MKENEHPFIIKLRSCFQSVDKIFLIMDYYQSGDLFHFLKTQIKFTEDAARFYTAEILLALEYLHKTLKIVYRY